MATGSAPKFLPLGDTAISIEFGDRVDREVNARVVALDATLNDRALDGVIETVPTFRSLTVHIDPLRADLDGIRRLVETSLGPVDVEPAPAQTWRIPVCYDDPELGPDLEDVARACGIAANDVVARHTARSYHVYMIGFLPGLPYMGDIDETIDLPRRTDPRVAVPGGSVAIAAGLSVIYPIQSPGGWHILGRTPLTLFDLGREPPGLFSPGDRVWFEPISRSEFDELAAVDALDWADYRVDHVGL